MKFQKIPKSPVPFLFLLSAMLFFAELKAQTAHISEELIEFTTYPFSEPDPVPELNRIYPYFYFDGYTNRPSGQKWKMVVLENEYIKVFICPDIGGKVWGAIEKSTGREFIYFNHVVKFRDIAMRGAWTSGGLEYNFGDIGHIPTCATPVDYTTMEYADGSVSCSVGAIDLPSGTRWNVEIKVSPGKAFFETTASWFNTTGMPCTYYHWMNAAAKASDDLEFIYPGKDWIGHGAETGLWPIANGRDLSWYKNNDFGSYKSYHVMNSYSGFFGGYWHREDFGFGRYGAFDEKPGKKLWIWGLAQEGMIWEQLLTDTDGQYIEFQAGKLFNQAAGSSAGTPFKHKEFAPHDADIMNEIWFPLKGTKGMVAASPWAVLNVVEKDNSRTLIISALQALDDELQVFVNGELRFSERVTLNPLELFESSVETGEEETIHLVLGEHKLTYSSDKQAVLVDRPLSPNEEFNWESAYGLYTRGLELEKQRDHAAAKGYYQKAVEADPGFLPALNRLALSQYRQMDRATALHTIRKSLSIDTYDGEANYLLGLICRETGDVSLSKSGFSVAMGSVAYRSAAATELANTYLTEMNVPQSITYARKALAYNAFNLDAMEILAVANRKTGDTTAAKKILAEISRLDATHPFPRFEAWLFSKDSSDRQQFIGSISNELPHETYLDLALAYLKKGCAEEAAEVLALAPEHPVADLWLATLDPDNKEMHINNALSRPPDFVFPHRAETAGILEAILVDHSHWKLQYYLGLILWNKGLVAEAKAQFLACGKTPDYAPFYLARFKLMDTRKEQLDHLEKAVALAPDSWRANLALADFYRTADNPDEALRVIEPFVAKYPEQPAIGLCYAQSLSALQKYRKAIAFLETYTVLPFEGATIGRDLYNDACVRSAFLALKSGQYDSTIYFAEKARLWPVNLGVGRPFDVDERLEDCILATAYESAGDPGQAGTYAARLREYEHPAYRQENSGLYLQLDALKKNGQNHKADTLLNRFLAADPENKYVQWAAAKITGSTEASSIENEIKLDEATEKPYETPFKDKRFQLLLDLLEIIEM